MNKNEEIYFEDLDLSDDVLDALYDMRFEKCTPIQAHCIPSILKGNDVIGIAQTGTGKTAAYLLPILTLLERNPHPADAINCLIMAPTRELAQQIDLALQGFGYYVNVNGIAVYGGNDGIRFEQEKRSLKRGADIVIATPGRLLTHLDLGNLDLRRTTHLILDEADRMLDMGFSDDIMKIVKQLPKNHQTILFSATMPDAINKFARSIMHEPKEVRIAVSKPAEKIQQNVYVCRETDKNLIIRHLFQQHNPKRVIIFCSSKQKVKELNILLKRAHFNCEAMHSDLLQQQRDEVMQGFKTGHIDILVATDIVARGIDINDIQMVINYNTPCDAEDYVHRIGRTARAGRDGIAITLVGERELFALRNIERLLEKKLPFTPLPNGLETPKMVMRNNQHGHIHKTKRSNHQHSNSSNKNKQGKPFYDRRPKKLITKNKSENNNN